jgi:sugar O-acyltransferase (sialic acid O-acetyltransferase NeuD family)
VTGGLLIVGAGGHGKVVADAALRQGGWNKIAFLDDAYPETDQAIGLAVLGKTDRAEQLLPDYPDAAVAIGNADIRLELLDRLEQLGFRLPVIKHPRATVSPHARIQAGSVIFAQGVINPDAELGRGCIVNTAATVDHDCRLGAGVHVAPGAHVGGGVRIGRKSWIGIGACIRQYIAIGAEVTIAAGAAVVSDVPDERTVAGVPATLITRSER